MREGGAIALLDLRVRPMLDGRDHIERIVRMLRPLLLAAAVVAVVPAVAYAHHSFAAFFDPSKTVTIKGKVTAFRFTNPHGTIVLDVADSDGKPREWRVETNAPVVLVRRGWSRSTLKPGDTITIEGWPSRDGKPWLRLGRAFDGTGKLIGNAPFEKTDD
jgi:hypothetical protein